VTTPCTPSPCTTCRCAGPLAAWLCVLCAVCGPPSSVCVLCVWRPCCPVAPAKRGRGEGAAAAVRTGSRRWGPPSPGRSWRVLAPLRGPGTDEPPDHGTHQQRLQPAPGAHSRRRAAARQGAGSRRLPPECWPPGPHPTAPPAPAAPAGLEPAQHGLRPWPLRRGRRQVGHHLGRGHQRRAGVRAARQEEQRQPRQVQRAGGRPHAAGGRVCGGGGAGVGGGKE
jgi:hypothetical protein